ncbi:recombination-associated protein RdgC [Pseudomonas sp. PLMAX]|uniref:recombination-associated protein RdgC n=1 Tax=Pseudomonas sp. PLMAX TaxID=2201998 RepID=UPI0038B84026
MPALIKPMIFKNLSIYSVPGEVNLETLEGHLNSMPFKHCLPSQEFTAGFARLYGSPSRVLTVNGCHLFCLMSEEKKIPPAVVRTKLRKVIEAKEISYGRRLKTAERKEAEEMVREGLIRSAEEFVQTKETWIYFDTKAKLLVINSSSAKTAASISEMVKPAISNKMLFPLRPQHDVSKKLTFWLAENQAPEPLVAGQKCGLTDDTGTIKYNKVTLEDPRLKGYLQDGMRVTALALSHKERCSFNLSEDFMITSFALTDLALEDLDHGTSEPLEQLAGDLVLMSKEVSALVDALMDALGGELNPEVDE